jgi:hypothetical protein
MPSRGVGLAATALKFGISVRENPMINRNPAMDWDGTKLPILVISPVIKSAPDNIIITIPATVGQGAAAVPEIIASMGIPPKRMEGTSARELMNDSSLSFGSTPAIPDVILPKEILEPMLRQMNLPAASGGVSCKCYVVHEVRSVRKLYNGGVCYHAISI